MATELEEKYTKGPFYLWSPVRMGGESSSVTDPLGRERRIVSKRNILPVGKKVTMKELTEGVEDDPERQWKEWVDGGVVRTYPYPDDLADSTDSPVVHLQKKIAAVATSEEERLTAEIQGVMSTDEGLVEAAAEVDKDNKEK
jgi:hypothetical protein